MYPSLRILIVEDELLIAEDLKEILLEVGYT
jgi:CheY-like chemotaxis protein